MIPISSIHYGILQQANHTDSEYLNQTTAPQRDYYINKSKDIVIEWLTGLDETNDTVRRYLTGLVIRGQKLKATVSDDRVIAQYPDNFFKQKAVFAVGKREGCPDRPIKVRRPTSEKFQAAIHNVNARRIWDFQQTFSQEAHNGLHLFTEPGVELEVYMDYIRKVPDVAYPSGSITGQYLRHDGELITEDINLDLDGAFFFNKIVALSTLQIKKDYFVPNEYQVEKDFILSIDRI